MSIPTSIPPRRAGIVLTALSDDLRALGSAVTDVVVPQLISSYDAMFAQHGFAGTLLQWGATGINWTLNTSTFVHDMGLEGFRDAVQAALDAGRMSVLNTTTVHRQQGLGGRVQAQPQAQPPAPPPAPPPAQPQAQPPAPPLAPPAQAQLPTGPLAPAPYSLRRRPAAGPPKKKQRT
jgi:hypothetical protein